MPKPSHVGLPVASRGWYRSTKLPPTFWERVRRDRHTQCWEWIGWIGDDGYPASIGIDCLRQSPFRHAYLRLVGVIPRGLTLDHLCRVRHCVNPAHADPCTRGENARRAKLLVKKCPQNHPYSADNIIWVGGGDGRPKRRGCRTCYNDRSRDYWHTTRKHDEKAARRTAGYRGGWDETEVCANDHPKTPDNIYTTPSGARKCLPCRREAAARYNAKKAGRL